MNTAGNHPARVLVMEADKGRAAELSSRLRYLKYEPVVANDADSIKQLAADNSIAVMLGDTTVGGELERAAKELMASRPELPVLVTDNDSSRSEFFGNCEPWHLDSPIRRSQLSYLLKRAERFEGCEKRQRLTGNSTTIRKVRELIERVAEFNTNVLVTGESGTGKELVARTVHDLSLRADKPFVPINCGAIPAELLESELFGHEKGAFTGAVSRRVGRFELAEGGTLFLDEIGDMTLDMQVKLLRVLQERTFERVGSNQSRNCNVRIVAATHRDLRAMVADGSFREDLFYRLNVFPIEMPPLCKRRSDLPQLLEELLLQQGGAHGTLRLSSAAFDALARYPWPGNIRELGNLVERLAIMHPEGEIDLDDLPQKYRDGQLPAADGSCSPPKNLPDDVNLKDYLQLVERELIEKALARCDGVVARAARELNMQRTTLLEKIGKYAIK
ncbi:MAG: sigma-54-dependent Fis family transcriptional regulator [Woeseia sp.]|nr:sigma-54-dependent Fis family transcriptional regulator [Woeseia sp.]